MTTPLLATKLYIPTVRPTLVPRPRLIESLSKGYLSDSKLTLVSAPAGFGKTTLVAEWLQAMGDATPPIAYAWLSLDDGDNDPARFLTYFIAALNQIKGIDSTLGEGSLIMLQSTQPPPIEVILTPLINEIAAIPDRIILVLDDYHLVDGQPIQDILSFMLENQPPQLHLVVATREDPLLPLPRLRARGQLTELRAADLRFTTVEATALLNQVMGLDLSVEDIAALEVRTEGWVAGLQLASLALQGTISTQGNADTSKLIQSFTGSHRFVLDYLVDEVLNQQPQNIQDFLLQTAILNRLTGSLCDAVTGQDDGHETLEYLDRANLFTVPLDNERRWYRYHHLFADLLRQRHDQSQPEFVKSLHQRASRWYEQQEFMDDAIEHALVIDDFDRAVHLIDVHADALWQQGEHIKLPRILNSVPTESILSKPHLCVFHAWYSFISGRQEISQQCLQAAEQALEIDSDSSIESRLPTQDSLSVPKKELLLGRIAAIRAFMDSLRGDLLELIQHAHQALELLPKDEKSWRSLTALTLGDVYGFKGDMPASYDARFEAYQACKAAGDTYNTMLASSKLVITLRAQGQLQQTIDLCEEQIHAASKFGQSQSPLIGFMLVVMGEVLAEQNELDRALDLATKGIGITENSINLVFLGWGYTNLMRIQFSKGNFAAVEEINQKLESMAQQSNVPGWIMGLKTSWQVRTWLAQGNLDAASQWVGKHGLSAESLLPHEIDFFSLFDYIILARIWIAQGQLNEAIKLLKHIFLVAERGGRTASMIEILMLQALAFGKQGDTDQSIYALKQSLTLAEPEGFVRIFVDEGPPMARLLYEALSHRIMPDYIQRLLEAFPVADIESTGPKSPTPDSDLIEALSERETEVLNLLAEGLTNQEIASRLYLSLNTVKVHTRNIYGKLGVNNRSQAVAKGRALGILS